MFRNIRLHILSAKNVPAADVNGFSDPYVTVFQGFGPRTIKVAKTAVISKTLQPEWNEKFDLFGLRGLDFKFKLWDHDRLSNDHLGSVKFKASSPLFPFGVPVELRVKVKDEYKRQFGVGRECTLKVMLEVLPLTPSALEEYGNDVRDKTVLPGRDETIPCGSAKERIYGYLHYDTAVPLDRMVGFKKPIKKTKDLAKQPVVLPPGWVSPPPPDFLSVPSIELNVFGLGPRGSVETACYGGDAKERGVIFSSWTPLFSPDGNFCSGVRIRLSKILGMVNPTTSISHIGFAAFLRAPLASWEPFTNIRFTLVDLGDADRSTRKGLIGVKQTPRVIASIPLVPNPMSSGMLFATLTKSSTRFVITNPQPPVYAMGPAVSWIPRSFREVLPEFAAAMGAPATAGRKLLTYPHRSMDVTTALLMAGVTKLGKFTVGLGWDTTTDLDASIMAFEGSRCSHLNSCYFGMRQIYDGAVVHHGDNRTGAGSGDDEKIDVDLTRLPSEVKYVVVTINSFSGLDFKSVSKAYARVVIGGAEILRVNLTKSKRKTAVAIVVFYRLAADPNFWGLMQMNHFCDGRSCVAIAPFVSQELEFLRSCKLID